MLLRAELPPAALQPKSRLRFPGVEATFTALFYPFNHVYEPRAELSITLLSNSTRSPSSANNIQTELAYEYYLAGIRIRVGLGIKQEPSSIANIPLFAILRFWLDVKTLASLAIQHAHGQ